LSDFVKLKYSKKNIRRAGEILIKENIDDNMYNEALNKLSNWRASYMYPLHVIYQLLKRRTLKVDKKAIIAQRLKRTPSIINKLKRFPSMKLDRMQDIGGCRAIVSNIEQVYKLRDSIIKGFSNHNLKKEYDYIKQIKESGYMGIHLIYQFQNQNKKHFNTHLIEIQLRTKLQHAWATSVEILGTYYGESFKSSQGSKEILEFFKKVGLLFLIEESKKDVVSIDKLKNSIINDITSLDLITKLKAFSVTTKHFSEQNKQKGYSLLVLNPDEKIVEITFFKDNQIEEAVNKYLKLEKASEIENDNIVLVSTESINNLKKAYPNYFADSKLFIKSIEKILNIKF